MNAIAARAQRIKPSPTLAVTERAIALRAAGRDVISLSAGEPDFDTPDFIKEAAQAAIAQGYTKYTAVDGSAELKQAIIEKFKRDNDLAYEPQEIIVSSGAKQSISNLLLACLDAGDEVIIPAPYWVSYPDMVLLADGKPVIVPTTMADGFKLTPGALEGALTPRTRALIINSPSNPTGKAYSHAEWRALADVLLHHPDVLIISDDIYEAMYWGKTPFVNAVMVEPALRERCVLINGVSKTYAMTGWRIGYAAGPLPLVKAMKTIQSQTTSNPCSISQKAACAALMGDQGCVTAMVATFQERHDYLLERLKGMAGIEVVAAEGAFYSFPDCRGLIKTMGLPDDAALAEWLLESVGIATVPGTAFGAPGFLRLSYAASTADISRAMDRLEEAISKAQR